MGGFHTLKLPDGISPNPPKVLLGKSRRDVPAQHRDALVAGRVGDDPLAHASGSGSGGQPSPQGVTRHLRGVDADRLRMALHDGGDGLRCEASGAELPVP